MKKLRVKGQPEKLKFFTIIGRSLRFRLIAWYVVVVGLTLFIFCGYFYFVLQQHEQFQLDANLQTAALQIIPQVSLESGIPKLPAQLDVQINRTEKKLDQGYLVRVFSPDGQLLASTGPFTRNIPNNSPLTSGYYTVPSENSNITWRLYNQLVEIPSLNSPAFNNFKGWIQVGWPTSLAYDALEDAYAPLLVVIPLVLLVAGLGGWFLARQVLLPITRVTRTAQAISSNDLAGRIGTSNSTLEIESLAATFDNMLDRLQAGFERERRFTSDASHELRTPLTALKGRIEVSLTRLRSQDEYKATLHDLDTEVDRLIRLTSSLLTLSRMDQNFQKWPREKLNLSELLDTIVETMQPLAESKNISITTTFSSNLIVQGNFDQLTRLFINLLDNAIKFTPWGGKVVFCLNKGENGDTACAEIADNGPGISAEHLPHLFERFYRIQSDRASNSGGAGLGLAIAYEIAQRHAGNISVVSFPQKGTRILVQLPLLNFEN